MKNKGIDIKHSKQRGEWAELRFMARAAEHGLCVTKPWGDSARYDFAVEHNGHFLRVQVKSTKSKQYNSYACNLRTTSHHAYTKDEVDFIAAYVIPKDVWYIIPIEVATNSSSNLILSPHLPNSKYDRYKEAWHLLRGEKAKPCGAGACGPGTCGAGALARVRSGQARTHPAADPGRAGSAAREQSGHSDQIRNLEVEEQEDDPQEDPEARTSSRRKPGRPADDPQAPAPTSDSTRSEATTPLMLITHPGVQGSKDPGMHSQPEPKFRLPTGYVELDIATAQLAGGAISIGQRNRERVHIDAGLAVVRYIDVISKTTLAIDLSGAADVAAGGASGEIRGDTGSMHFHASSVIDVLKVPPHRPVLDSARHTKVGPSGVGGYPSTARNEVIRGVAVRLTRNVGNVGVC